MEMKWDLRKNIMWHEGLHLNSSCVIYDRILIFSSAKWNNVCRKPQRRYKDLENMNYFSKTLVGQKHKEPAVFTLAFLVLFHEHVWKNAKQVYM